jgi:hypothetical protein
MERKPFDSRIQNMVYALDVGFGLRVMQIALATLGIVGLMLVFTATQFRGLKDAEAMDAAQIGRNLMQGRGFATLCVRPASMGQVQTVAPQAGPRVLNHPDLYHAPLYPALLSIGFRAFPGAFAGAKPGGVFAPEQWVIVPVNHVFLLLSGLFAFLIARRLLGNAKALLCILSYFLSFLIWNDSISGLGIPVVMCFVLASFYFALMAGYRLEEDRTRPALFFALASAVAGALAVLTRYAAFPALLGVIFYLGLCFGKRRWFVPVLYVAVLTVALAPWMLRNQRLSGRPFGLAPRAALYESRMYADQGVEQTMKPALGFGSVLQSLRAKSLEKLDSYYRNRFFSFGEGLMFPFFLAALFFRFIRRDLQGFRWAVVLSLLALFLTACVFGDGVLRLMNVLWPLVTLFGIAFFFLLLDRLQLSLKLFRVALISLMLSLAALPMILALLPPRAPMPYPPYFPPFIVNVSNMLQPTEVLMTDMPWATAWYGNRSSILLTRDMDGFFAINDFQQRISAIYFTTLTRDKAWIRELKTGDYKTWLPILEGRIPREFPMMHGFPMNNLDQLFLTDRPRWTEQS